MNHRRHIYFSSLLSIALACTTEPTPSTEVAKQAQAEPEAKPPVPADGFFMAEGAPQPRTCTSASDCLGDTIPDLDNPCCQNPYSLEAHARAYRQWVATWRKDNCASVTCPPPPAPSQPPACAFEVDCVQGTCVDGCKD